MPHQLVLLPQPRMLKPNCSFGVFRQIARYSASGYLPGYGTWKWNSNRTLYRFYPSLCNQQYGVEIPSGKVTSCLRSQSVRYIVVPGDSNEVQYYAALYKQLSCHSTDCEVQRRSHISSSF